MNQTTLLNAIEKHLRVVEIDFQNDQWRSSVPSNPGWYFIETNTPPDVLENVGLPKGQRHYNIPEKVKASLSLESFDACILPTNNTFYFVYSGEAKNIKARALEHLSGHPKTGCLALVNYPLLKKYRWKFHFSLCDFGNNENENKLIRTFGEQMWRAKYGWPILCGK
jgi:hypothetical protein